MNLSKKDKKIARQLIEKGLQRELAKGLYDFDTVLYDWKDGKIDNTTAYHTLYKKMRTFDKHIARRYDYLSGSNYLITVIALLMDGIISEEETSDFSPEVQRQIKRWLSVSES
jgi:predicted metal-dependent peptidase